MFHASARLYRCSSFYNSPFFTGGYPVIDICNVTTHYETQVPERWEFVDTVQCCRTHNLSDTPHLRQICPSMAQLPNNMYTHQGQLLSKNSHVYVEKSPHKLRFSQSSGSFASNDVNMICLGGLLRCTWAHVTHRLQKSSTSRRQPIQWPLRLTWCWVLRTPKWQSVWPPWACLMNSCPITLGTIRRRNPVKLFAFHIFLYSILLHTINVSHCA
jgi:hypothetical protein